MALFKIDRYYGDDVENIPQNQSAVLLKQLYENVENKKKEKLQLNKCLDSVDHTPKGVNTSKRKASEKNVSTSLSSPKKSKKERICDPETEMISEQNDSATVSKHKKKKKNHQVTDLDDNLSYPLSNSEKTEKKVKKSTIVAKDSENESGNEGPKHEKRKKSNTSYNIKEDNVNLKKTREIMSAVSDISSKQVKEGPHLVGNFTVLGEFKVRPEKKVKPYLPEWLAKPGIIKTDLEQTPVEHLHILHPCLIKKLKENNISHFFPVQTCILPVILKDFGGQVGFNKTGSPLRDVCISAPTGSGKTLAYILPILHILLPRNVCRIRALIVLPVRDLALQVFKVVENYCQGTQLKVQLLGGQQAFEEEQKSLVVKKMAGYLSLVDIIVATPGRLVDHINKTPGFELSRLRFLVIDEADRMMDNIKQNWLQVVEKNVFKVHYPNDPVKKLDRTETSDSTQASTNGIKLSFQKLLFSATLSQDPEILQQMKLFQPQLFTALVSSKCTKNMESEDILPKKEEKRSKDQKHHIEEGEFVGKYSTPPTLKQLHVECKAMDKPLAVLHCLHNLQYRQILCFTNSIESTHRLYLLIKLYGDIEVREFSSALTVAAREKILQEFAQCKVDMVICSDAMARGIDIENVQYVILYDRPLHIQNYIHRVGRTARAGKIGSAITILEKREVCTYKTMLRESGKEKFKKLKIKPNKLFLLKPRYNDALYKLPLILKEEKRGKRTY